MDNFLDLKILSQKQIANKAERIAKKTNTNGKNVYWHTACFLKAHATVMLRPNTTLSALLMQLNGQCFCGRADPNCNRCSKAMK